MAKKKVINGFENATEQYHTTHKVEKRKGTKPDLSKLKKNQSVCYGDGKTYYVLLTKRSRPISVIEFYTKKEMRSFQEPNYLNETYSGTEWKQ